jgi:hypothetical protein
MILPGKIPFRGAHAARVLFSAARRKRMGALRIAGTVVAKGPFSVPTISRSTSRRTEHASGVRSPDE